MSQPTAASVLDGLAAYGAVTLRRVPPAKYYSLNREHLLVQVLLQALDVERSLRDRLLKYVRDELEPVGLVDVRLFGSAAREQMRPDSDVDLALICKPGRSAQVLETSTELHEQVWRRFGVRPSFLVGEVSVDAMASGEESPMGVWHQVREHGVSLSA